jgi:hypothetical protein
LLALHKKLNSLPCTLSFTTIISTLDSLEKDISNLYEELSENAEAPGGVRNAEDGDVTEEADGRVTVEFLDRQISGNTKNSQKIPRRRLTDSPEF